MSTGQDPAPPDFGTWLLDQTGRADYTGELARLVRDSPCCDGNSETLAEHMLHRHRPRDAAAVLRAVAEWRTATTDRPVTRYRIASSAMMTEYPMGEAHAARYDEDVTLCGLQLETLHIAWRAGDWPPPEFTWRCATCNLAAAKTADDL